MGFRLRRKVFEVIPMGMYAATVKNVELAEGQYGEQLSWLFSVDDSDTELRAWSSSTMSDKSKTGRWVRSILGQVPDVLEADALLGQPCMLSVLVKPKADGSGTFNKVDEVLPAKRKPKPQPVPVEPEPDADGVEPLPF